MRGWAKELLVTFAVILGSLSSPSWNASCLYRDALGVLRISDAAGFWQPGIFWIPDPQYSRLSGSNRFARERLQDTLLGLFLGALNGYLILWHPLVLLVEANYPFPTSPRPTHPRLWGRPAVKLLPLSPHVVRNPDIYFAIAMLSFLCW